jgi:hypothetical protein
MMDKIKSLVINNLECVLPFVFYAILLSIVLFNINEIAEFLLY